MAFNDNAVFTAATGYIYTAPVGTAAPTPEQLAEFNPDTFGMSEYLLSVSGKPTGGTIDMTVSGKSIKVPYNASAAQIQQAIVDAEVAGSDDVVVTSSSEGIYEVAINFGDRAATFTARATNLTGGTEVEVDVEPMESDFGNWSTLGHTDAEELPEFGYEGGDSETKGTWQKKSFKEISTEAPVDYVTFRALQFDNETFELYYGKNASKTENVFGVDNPAEGKAERALLIILADGDYKIGFSAAKTSIRREEALSLATDDFSKLPLRATFIKSPGRHLFEWTQPAA